MGRIYTVQFENVAVTAAQDFFEIAPASNTPVALHALLLTQSSDVGDAEEEMLRVSIVRGHSTGGSGGSAGTENPLSPLDTAAAFVAEINNTTIASAGTPLTLLSYSFNIRAGLELWFPPELRPICTAAQTNIVVRLHSTPADSLSMSGTVFVEELA
jgi:hypothetical protein